MGRNERRPETRPVVVSKTLSRVLRHSAENEKIELNHQGYAKISDLLKWHKAKSLGITFEEILEAVVDNNKQRFALLYQPAAEQGIKDAPEEIADGLKTLSVEGQRTTTQIAQEKAKEDPNPSHYLIRATQGHSIKTIDSAEYLEPITLDKPESIPDTVVHGTYHAAWPLILATGGLKSGTRVHIHFAHGPKIEEVMPEGIDGPVVPKSAIVLGQGSKKVISGMRNDSQVLIYINVKKALEAGVSFWKSENGVILSEGKENAKGAKVVATDFFDVVIEVGQKLGVLWKNGEVTKELPQELIKKGMPRGKSAGNNQQKQGRRRNDKPKLNVDKTEDME